MSSIGGSEEALNKFASAFNEVVELYKTETGGIKRCRAIDLTSIAVGRLAESNKPAYAEIGSLWNNFKKLVEDIENVSEKAVDLQTQKVFQAIRRYQAVESEGVEEGKTRSPSLGSTTSTDSYQSAQDYPTVAADSWQYTLNHRQAANNLIGFLRKLLKEQIENGINELNQTHMVTTVECIFQHIKNAPAEFHYDLIDKLLTSLDVNNLIACSNTPLKSLVFEWLIQISGSNSEISLLITPVLILELAKKLEEEELNHSDTARFVKSIFSEIKKAPKEFHQDLVEDLLREFCIESNHVSIIELCTNDELKKLIFKELTEMVNGKLILKSELIEDMLDCTFTMK